MTWRAGRKTRPRLEGWGDLEDDTNYGESLADWLEEPDVVKKVVDNRVKEPVAMPIVEIETLSLLQKSSKLTEKKTSVQESGRTSLCSTPRER